jgi:nucleotide-binding universal stress UspA family protein
MTNVLVPVDGSENSLRALDFACSQIAHGKPMPLLLLNVQAANHSGVVKKYLSPELIEKFYQEEGDTALQSARTRLDNAGIAYTARVEVGDVAQAIARVAREQHCSQIVMGTRGLSASGLASISGLLMGSIATKVLHLTDVPVTLVK